jgi:enterochelin esterase-like enzyme
MRGKTTRRTVVASFLLLLLVLGFAALYYSRERGNVETVEYQSTIAGGARRMVVYLPPGYPHDAPYPVLYLLHGAGDDETTWRKEGSADTILDRLYTAGTALPMLVAMPNSRGRGSAFEQDLLDEVVPFVESHYSTRSDARGRAIAGVSLGGGQALRIGLRHPERFGSIGAFSPSLAGKIETDVMDQLEHYPQGNDPGKLLWLSCGDQDQLKEVDEALHHNLKAKGIPHIWHMGSGEHEWSVWRNDLRQFAMLLFRQSRDQSSQ